MILVYCMRQLVDENVVLDPNWSEDKPPIQSDRSVIVPPATG